MRSLLQKENGAVLLTFSLMSLFAAAFSPSAYHPVTQQKRAVSRYPASISLSANLEDDNQVEAKQAGETSESGAEENFDGEGFANYLAPYAVALLASIAVTGGFVKFVLMDY